MTSDKAEKSKGWVLVVGMIIVVISILALLALIEAWVYNLFQEWESRGLFGDMFGVGNAVFSALAFAGVILAIFLQREELKLQRQELKLTRNEVKGQKEQLQTQAETLKKQTLENTFFELLRFH